MSKTERVVNARGSNICTSMGEWFSVVAELFVMEIFVFRFRLLLDRSSELLVIFVIQIRPIQMHSIHMAVQIFSCHDSLHVG